MKSINNNQSEIKKASVDAEMQGLNTPSQSTDAFSVADKLPSYIHLKNREPDKWESYAPLAFLEIRKIGFIGASEVVWSVAYVTIDGDRSITFFADWLLGACTKMCVWLLENNYKLDE